MSQQNAFKRILASLYEAMLDDTLWPGTSALIDEACGITGNTLLVGEGPKDDVRVVFVGHYYRGQRRKDLEREYLEVYHPIDERVPRLRQLPDSRLVHVTELYTAEELKTSPTYNEIMLRCDHQDSLNVRLAQLMADALPSSGAVALSGSMRLGRSSGWPPFVVHVKPVDVPQPDYGAPHVAALVLIVEPGRHQRLDSDGVPGLWG